MNTAPPVTCRKTTREASCRSVFQDDEDPFADNYEDCG